MKVMLTGTDTLWGLWLGFFREDLVALLSVVVLIPAALYLNWRLALLLIALCLVFVMLNVLVLRRTEALQRSVERYYSDLAEHASDTLGNIALVQSFTGSPTRSALCAMWWTSCSARRSRCCPGGHWRPRSPRRPPR